MLVEGAGHYIFSPGFLKLLMLTLPIRPQKNLTHYVLRLTQTHFMRRLIKPAPLAAVWLTNMGEWLQ
jgi:hypothetical protein